MMMRRYGPIDDVINRVLSRLVETHTRPLYHFMCMDSLCHALECGRFDLADREADNNPHGDESYFLSLTRQRNTSQGYPYMVNHEGGTINNSGDYGLFIRLEMDVDELRRYGRVEPFDWVYEEGYEDMDHASRVNGKQDAMSFGYEAHYDEDSRNQFYRQPWSQAEERLFTRHSSIPFDKRTVKRIDIYYDREIDDENLRKLRKIAKKYTGWVHVYKGKGGKNLFHLQK